MTAPAPDDSRSFPDEFDFTRVGLRVPTLLISPWIEKGTIISDPTDRQKPANDSVFELTSIPATMKKMFNLTSFLTKRDAWAATFDDVLTTRDTPRTDCISTLPDAPTVLSDEQAAWEANRPLNDLQRDYLRVISAINNATIDHVTHQGHGGKFVEEQTQSILRGEGLLGLIAGDHGSVYLKR